MKGRRPEPGELQALKGNPGRRRKPPLIDVAPVEGGPPAHLGEGAKRIWQRLAPDLTALKFLRSTDAAAFAMLCDDLAKLWELRRRIEQEGDIYIVESNHGKYRRLNPLVMREDRITKRAIDQMDRFGMSPAMRQRIFLQLATTPTSLPLGDVPGKPAPEAPSPIGMLAGGLLN